jgi:hypothetical protein
MPFGLPGTFPWGDEPIPGVITHDFDTAQEAIDRLIQQYKQPNLEALVGVLAYPCQDLEDALNQLYDSQWLNTSTGQQLDNLGALVGRPRNGLTDDIYRLFLQAQILVNKSSGGPEEIYSVFSLIVPAGTTLALQYYAPASFTLTLTGAIPANTVTVFTQILSALRGAGINGQLVYSLAAPSATFTFDGASGQGFDQGGFAGAVQS